MIHHLSIAARDPQHVAEVLAEFMGGAATRFTPNPGSWFAHQADEYGTGVEVYPAGTELHPAGPEGAGFAMTEPIRPDYSPTHFALSVPISQEQITAIAGREGWQCYCCERGAGGFHVMEVWIENTEGHEADLETDNGFGGCWPDARHLAHPLHNRNR
jgi:hypothetical protein